MHRIWNAPAGASRALGSPRRLLRSPSGSRNVHSTPVVTVDLDYEVHVPPGGNKTEQPLVILHGLLCVTRILTSRTLLICIQRKQEELVVAV